MTVEEYSMIIGGERVPAVGLETFEVVNPSTEKVVARVPLGGKADARKAVDVAREAFDKGLWSDKTPAQRAHILLKVADLVEEHADELARLESTSQGKPIKMARSGDLPFTVDNLRFFAGAARMLHGLAANEYMETGTSIIRREPVGVVAGVVPWNYPLMIAVWKLAPALAAGNTVVLKPASYTPLTCLRLGEICEKAGVPNGVVSVVTGPGSTVGEELASNSKVDMFSITGDTETGKRVMQLAAPTVKKLHLELGGKAPFIVFEDADIDAATEAAVVGGYVNSGQDCTAATRIFVHKKVYDRFNKILTDKVAKIKVGDQLDPKTDMGPLVSKEQLERVDGYVRSGKKEGARLLIGGERLNRKGYFYSPSVFIDAKQEMSICKNEIFGPVITVLPFTDEAEVVNQSNNVVYGLASSIWTRDLRRAMNVSRKLRFGEVWINDHLPLTSEMPHGGYKQSGSGKDLSIYAFEEFTNIKHVYVDLTGKVRKLFYDTIIGS